MRLKGLKILLESFKKDFDVIEKEELDNLRNYDVDRLDELLDVIQYVKDNNLLGDAVDPALELRDKFYDKGIGERFSKEVPFMSSAIEILGGYDIPIYVNSYRFADAACLEAMEYIISTNYYMNGCRNAEEVFERCSKGDILICLTLFAEDFRDVEMVPHHYRNTLRKIKRVKMAK